MSEKYLTPQDIINWIKEWTSKHPDHTEANAKAFAEGLAEQMKRLDYTVPDGGTVIAYAGRLGTEGNTGIYHTVSDVTKNSKKYIFINNYADNILNNENYRFSYAIENAVGKEYARRILGGNEVDGVRSKYSFDDILSINDLVSENFMAKNAKGDVRVLILDNAGLDSTLNVTELEKVLSMPEVESINGIDKHTLLSMDSETRFNYLKEDSALKLKDAQICTTADGVEMLSFEGTEFKKRVVKCLGTIQIGNMVHGKELLHMIR